MHFEPQVQLSKVDITTGTENEETKFAERSKLYRFVGGEGVTQN